MRARPRFRPGGASNDEHGDLRIGLRTRRQRVWLRRRRRKRGGDLCAMSSSVDPTSVGCRLPIASPKPQLAHQHRAGTAKPRRVGSPRLGSRGRETVALHQPQGVIEQPDCDREPTWSRARSQRRRCTAHRIEHCAPGERSPGHGLLRNRPRPPSNRIIDTDLVARRRHPRGPPHRRRTRTSAEPWAAAVFTSPVAARCARPSTPDPSPTATAKTRSPRAWLVGRPRPGSPSHA